MQSIWLLSLLRTDVGWPVTITLLKVGGWDLRVVVWLDPEREVGDRQQAPCRTGSALSPQLLASRGKIAFPLSPVNLCSLAERPTGAISPHP